MPFEVEVRVSLGAKSGNAKATLLGETLNEATGTMRDDANPNPRPHPIPTPTLAVTLIPHLA